MTKKETLDKIKSMGLTARYDSDFREYRINFKDGNEASAYYTDSADDAISTAQRMVEWRKSHPQLTDD